MIQQEAALREQVEAKLKTLPPERRGPMADELEMWAAQSDDGLRDWLLGLVIELREEP